MNFESKGARYEGRTEQIEMIKLGDEVRIMRDKSNQFNSNNFIILTCKDRDLGGPKSYVTQWHRYTMKED